MVASVDTYLRFAEAVSRLDISSEKQGLPELVSGSKQSAATCVTKGILERVATRYVQWRQRTAPMSFREEPFSAPVT